jgi:hypothetical protein
MVVRLEIINITVEMCGVGNSRLQDDDFLGALRRYSVTQVSAVLQFEKESTVMRLF